MHTFSAVRCVFLILFVLIASPHICLAAPPSPVTVEVAEVGKSKELVSALKAKGINAVIQEKNLRVVDEQTNSAVWIGKNVPLETLRTVLPEAIRLYPYLQFFHVVGDRGEKPPAKVDDTVHIGGSIEAALYLKLNVIDREELKKQLAAAKDLEELHRYLHEKNVPRPEEGAAKP